MLGFCLLIIFCVVLLTEVKKITFQLRVITPMEYTMMDFQKGFVSSFYYLEGKIKVQKFLEIMARNTAFPKLMFDSSKIYKQLNDVTLKKN